MRLAASQPEKNCGLAAENNAARRHATTRIMISKPVDYSSVVLVCCNLILIAVVQLMYNQPINTTAFQLIKLIGFN
jgi:hypothetical protein